MIIITEYSPSWNWFLIYPEWNLRKNYCHNTWNVRLNHKITHLPSEVKINRHNDIFTCEWNMRKIRYRFCGQLFNGFIIIFQTNKQYSRQESIGLSNNTRTEKYVVPNWGGEWYCPSLHRKTFLLHVVIKQLNKLGYNFIKILCSAFYFKAIGLHLQHFLEQNLDLTFMENH